MAIQIGYLIKRIANLEIEDEEKAKMLQHIFSKQLLWGLFPLAGFVVGDYLDRLETERLSLFRDKSALYGRELKEGERPTWP